MLKRSRSLPVPVPRRVYHEAPVRPYENLNEYCESCIIAFALEADRQRPGHVWSVVNNKIVFLEDAIAESMLGRKLTENDVVVHKDDNPAHNSRANLEIVTIYDLGAN